MDEQAGGAAALGVLVVLAAAATVVFLSRSGATPIVIGFGAVFVAFLATATVLAAVETSRR